MVVAIDPSGQRPERSRLPHRPTGKSPTRTSRRLTAAALCVGLLRPFPATASPPAGERASRLTAQEADVLVRDVSAKVEQLRGLKFKTPVTMKVIDGATAREDFKAKITPWDEQEIRHTQHAYVHLGLIPRSADLLAGALHLVEKDVAGYYQQGTKTFYLLDHVSAEEVRPVMAHELTHALEDQHYDFDAITKKASGDGDHATAISALIEGSAMVVMLAFQSREQGGERATSDLEKREAKRAARLGVAPSFTQRSLILPYVLGFTFLLRGKPWEWGDTGVKLQDINGAYRNPPRSTREILHPPEYWDRAERMKPQRLELPDLSSVLGPGWSKATGGSIGELGLAVLTGSNRPIEMPWAFLPSRWTTDAAIGTAGDVFHHYVNGERTATVLLTRWETKLDADEFDRAVLSKGKHYFRYGVNILLIAGDVGERAEPLAIAALQGSRYHPFE